MTAKFPLEVVIKAVDKATAPVRALTVQIHKLTAPLKNIKLFDQVRSLGKAINFEGISKGLSGVGSAMGKVGSEVFSLGAKLAGIAVAAGAAFFHIIKSSVDAGDKLGEMADRVGLTVDVYASLGHAAAQADVDQESFNTAMDKFNKNMGEMTHGKGGEFLHFLNEVSPTLAKQVKAAKGTEAALALMTDAFARIDDPAKSAALSAAAFGKSGLQMGRFLHQGSAAIQEQQRRYFELTGSQEDFAKGAGELDNAMRENDLAFTGLRNTLAGAFFPALTELSKLVTTFLSKNRDGLKKWATSTATALQKWIDSGGFERLVENLKAVAESIGKVVEWLGPMGTMLAGVAVLALPLIASVGSLGVAMLSLAVEAFPLLYAAGAALWPVITAVAGSIGAFAASIAPALLAVAPFLFIAGALVFIAKRIGDNWGALSYIFKDWGNSIKWAVLDAWEAVRPILEKLSAFFGTTSTFGVALSAGNAAAAALTPSAVAAAAPTPDTSFQSEARVSVDFANLPRGARVSSDPTSSQPVDLSMGYSMVTP